MTNPLANIFNQQPLDFRTAHTTPAFIGEPLDVNTLFNGSGEETAPVQEPAPVSTFSGSAPTPTAAPVQQSAPENNFYDKYKDPKTGEIMSPEEYAIYLGNKVPRGNGEIPNYAGDAMTNPNQSSNELESRARNLNNSRNDIATGTTDPYSVGNQSGIAYSPKELKAIESAYAGVYDPALNDVFSRLQDKKAEDAKMTAREDRIFETNEAIRKWRATTGAKSSSSGSGSDSGGDDDDSEFSFLKIADGAGRAGVSLETFKSYDDELKNFYLYSPEMDFINVADDVKDYYTAPASFDGDNSKAPMYQVFEAYYKAIEAGAYDPNEMATLIKESVLPEPVKIHATYLIPSPPSEEEEEDEGIDWFWKSKWLN